MFGYIKVDKTALQGNEFGLYHAFFCNLCISSKSQFGFSSRMLTNFDTAFFNLLFHSFLEVDVEVENSKCLTTPFKKRSMIKTTPLGDRMAQGNVILCYLNLLDDVQDGSGRGLGRCLALNSIKRPYKKAKKLFPELDQALTACYQDLRKLEIENCKIFDKVCHPFAQLSAEFCQVILNDQWTAAGSQKEENLEHVNGNSSLDSANTKSNEYIRDLCYNLGKWVYLIDALDDLEKDYKKKNYNPFINCFGNYANAKQFVAENHDGLQFIFYTTLNKIAENYNDLDLVRYTCVLSNVLHKSIRDKTESVFAKYA